MLPLSKPALSTLTIFTFVNTWNDFLGPMIYLTKTELKTIQQIGNSPKAAPNVIELNAKGAGMP